MAQFSWTNQGDETLKIKTFLAQRGVSHRMFSIVKRGGGSVLLDGKQVRTVDEVKPGDKVTIVMPPEESNDVVAMSDLPITVLFEDENWMEVEKEAGVTSVPGKADRETTMVNRVKGYLARSGAEDLVPHVVTRLDRFTSGVALLAKHRFAHGLLDKQLQTVDKRYYAIVDGDLEDDYGFIDAPIGRMDDDFIRREVREDGRPSQTEYWVVKRFGNQTLVRVQLRTGRTHQIRVHMAYIGHPVAGDPLYGPKKTLPGNGQYLHAATLGLTQPTTGEEMTFEAPLPAYFTEMLDQLDPYAEIDAN